MSKTEVRRSLRFAAFELRNLDAGSVKFTGYASTFGQPYDVSGWFTETVQAGAFTKTLSESPDVRLLINHDGLPLARTTSGTLKLSQDATGLYCETMLDTSDPDVQRIMPKMARGDLDEMSFAFRVTKDDWSEDYTERTILEASLKNGDVSIVTYPANPNASAQINSLRSLAAEKPEVIRAVYAELRAGATISKSTADGLRSALESLETIDEESESAQSAIAELLGLANSGGSDSTEDDDASADSVQQDSARSGMNAATARSRASRLLARSAQAAR